MRGEGEEKYGTESIWFGNDCFNVDGDHMLAIAEGLMERGLKVNWFYQGRADLLVRYRDLLPLMRRAGNRMVQIGIEASTDEERDEWSSRLSVASWAASGSRRASCQGCRKASSSPILSATPAFSTWFTLPRGRRAPAPALSASRSPSSRRGRGAAP